jgi:hypothetical protein
LSSVADYVNRKDAFDGDSCRAAVFDRETHTLKEKIAGLPQIDAAYAEGRAHELPRRA